MNSSVVVRDLLGTWTVSAQSAWTVGAPCEGMDFGSCCICHQRKDVLQGRKLVIFEQGGRLILTSSLRSSLPSLLPLCKDSYAAEIFPAAWADESFGRMGTTVSRISDDGGGAVLHLDMSPVYLQDTTHLQEYIVCLFVELPGCSNRLRLSYLMHFKKGLAPDLGQRIQYANIFSFPRCALVSRESAPAGNCTHGLLDPLPLEQQDVWISFSLERSKSASAGCEHQEGRSIDSQDVQSEVWWQRDWLLMSVAGIGLVATMVCICAVVFARHCRRHTLSPPAATTARATRNCKAPERIDLSDGVFEQDNLAAIVRQGMEEHWLLKPEAITLQRESQSGGAVQSKQRGFLNGTTEVLVKSVGRDSSADDILVELRILRHARHANIVAFYGFTYTTEISMMMALEWVPGNFEDYVKRRRSDGSFSDELRLLSSKNACCKIDEWRLLTDVVRGMQYLHSLIPAIAHSGLKPSSVLVDEGRTPCVGKLSDFSRSVLVEQPNSAQESGPSPEMLGAEVEANPLKGDIFDFGLVALFAATSEVAEPSVLGGDYLQRARQLGEGEIGGLAHIIMVAESCLSDVRPGFTEIFFQLSVDM